MKILHVTDCYLPRLGGIEMHVSDLARRQQDAGHEVTVLTRTSPGPAGEQVAVAVERHPGGPLRWGAGRHARDVASTLAADIVHAHLSVASPFAVAALKASTDLPTIATIHSVVPDSPLALRSALALGGFPSRSVVFTAVSEAAAQPWRHAMGDRMPVRILSNGIDPAAWQVQHDPGTGRTFTVVTVGRLARRKRQRAFVHMLSRLRDELPTGIDLRAVIVGDGDQYEAVTGDIARAGLADQVEMPGALSRSEIRCVLARADVYVAPAVLESFGIAALEARCAGVPVVGMSRSGVGEFVTDGVEGLLVEDDAQMLDAVRRLALSPDLRMVMQHHNAMTEPPMAWPLVLAQHDQVYARARERVVGASPQRRLGSVLTTP